MLTRSFLQLALYCMKTETSGTKYFIFERFPALQHGGSVQHPADRDQTDLWVLRDRKTGEDEHFS